MDTPFPTLSLDMLDAQASAKAVAPAVAATPATPAVPMSAEPVSAAPTSESPAVPASTPVKAAARAAAQPAEMLRDALALAIDTSAQVMENLTGRALLSLDRKSTANPNPDERAQLDSAAATMDAHRRRWVRQFPALLRVACAHPLPPEKAALLPVADMRICAAELEALTELVLNLGSQRGNPMGPQTYVRAICELVARSEGNAMQRQHWQAYLLAALGTQLAWVYPQVIATLRTPGSREGSALSKEADFADYAAFTFGLGGKAPPALEPVAEAAPPPMPITPEMRALAQEARRTVAKMRKALGMPELEDDEPQHGQPVDEMARMMRDIEESERLMVQMQERGIPMPEDDGMSDEARLAEKVERLLSDFRNRTSPTLARVPQPVREAFERMQEPLVRLATVDGSLLKQEAHPARQLLDDISKRSLSYAQDDVKDSPAFAAFLTTITKLFDALGAVAQPSSKIYTQAVAKMQPVWQQMDEMLKQTEERKEKELAQQEVRKQLASRLAFELVSRSDAGDAPVAIKQFLMGSWAQVLARSQLHPQHPGDEPRYLRTLAILLWSVSVRRAGGYKDKLVAEIPDLMKSLKAGLLSVQVPQGNIDAFFTDLKKLHDEVINADMEAGDPDDDDFPLEPLDASSSPADISDMMMLQEDSKRPPPGPPSYSSDLNLI
ncbi:MAG: DUF1631 family protein [Brachymonas sp.]